MGLVTVLEEKTHRDTLRLQLKDEKMKLRRISPDRQLRADIKCKKFRTFMASVETVVENQVEEERISQDFS